MKSMSNNEEITLKVERTAVTVAIGRAGRLWYQAPGLDIYVAGAVKASQQHLVHFQAVSEAIDRHIPAIRLKNVRDCGCRRKKIPANQKSLL